MPQNPILNFVANPGGLFSALNVTTAAVIKASAGKIRRILVVTAGSGGNLTINDLAATSGSAAGNTVAVIPNSLLTAGAVITLDFPCKTGIAITGVPTGSPVLSVSYD